MANPEIEITIDMKRFRKAMAQAPDRLFVEIRRFFKAHHNSFIRFIKTRRIASRKGSGGQAALKNRLTSRSKTLRQSMLTEDFGRDVDTLEVVSFSTAKHARIHEVGGTITPKKSNWLTIPLRAAKTKSGIARGKARDYANTFFIKHKTDPNKLLLVRSLGDDDIEPLFVLVKSITLRPRLGWGKTWKKFLPKVGPGIDKAVGRALAPRPA